MKKTVQTPLYGNRSAFYFLLEFFGCSHQINYGADVDVLDSGPSEVPRVLRSINRRDAPVCVLSLTARRGEEDTVGLQARRDGPALAITVMAIVTYDGPSCLHFDSKLEAGTRMTCFIESPLNLNFASRRLHVPSVSRYMNYNVICFMLRG